ncbi:MAG: hypothetical protein RIC55_36710 [Pirellulaceae bacterium]
MELCPHCRVEIVASHAPSTTCPACGGSLARETAARWTSVARLANLAETGYFADLLQADGVPTNVLHHSEFDAVDGAWRSLYVLQVPEGRAAEAAESLRRELELTDDAASESWSGESWRRASGQHAPSGVSVWKPVALMLVASGLAYCAGRTGMERPPVARPTHDELLKALHDLPRDTVFRSDDGQTERKLMVGPDGTVILEEDDDLDGRPNRLRIFRDGVKVADTVP